MNSPARHLWHVDGEEIRDWTADVGAYRACACACQVGDAQKTSCLHIGDKAGSQRPVDGVENARRQANNDRRRCR